MHKTLAPPNDTAEVVVWYLEDDYQQIVKPNRLFLVPNYFIIYWLRRLGPTLAWIVLSLQQACWRNPHKDDRCTITQASIAEEIGIHRHTVAKELKENPWSVWHIPKIEHQKGVTDKDGSYYPLPRRYYIYEQPPLIPEHLAGLLIYFQETCPGGALVDIHTAINHLQKMKPKDSLSTLEQYAKKATLEIEEPLSIKAIIERATGIKVESLPPEQAKELRRHCSALYTHLTDLGKTMCRQYFRLEWVPLLKPAMGWLVMALRMRCYYNPETGVLVDRVTWRKKELRELIGQSMNNLPNLLAHPYASHFIQVIEEKRHTLTLRIAMTSEPLTTESAAEFWNRPIDSQNLDITPLQNSQNLDITPLQNSQNLDTTSPRLTESRLI